MGDHWSFCMTDPQPPSSAVVLARKLLWNTPEGMPRRAMPTVILLGPYGAGKTKTLKTISDICGSGIIHASYSFSRENSTSTIEVLLDLSIELSRTWAARGTLRFTRFALSLIAIQAIIDDRLPDSVRRAIEIAVKEFATNRSPKGLASRIETFVDTTTSVSTIWPKVQPFVKLSQTLIRALLPSLIRAANRRRVQRALDWHAGFRHAQGAASIDALVRLRGLYRNDQAAATEWLVAAFLADVRENHAMTARADRYVKNCPCFEAAEQQHTHNWILLLDNIDHPHGQQFLNDLAQSRVSHHRSNPDDDDPIVVVSTSGRWPGPWDEAWCPPWIVPEQDRKKRQPVVRCSNAGYPQWAKAIEATQDFNLAKYYPVLLDNLDASDVAAILDTRIDSQLCDNVVCVTGGLPAAVLKVAKALKLRQIDPTAKDISTLSHGVTTDERVSLWSTALNELELDRKLHGIELDDIVDATPHLTAPWLVPTNKVPDVRPILEELRATLWGTTTSHKIDYAENAEIHPWLGRLLLLALRAREVGPEDYTSQFAIFRAGLNPGPDMTQLNYCDLAVGKVPEVARSMAEVFDSESHTSWVFRFAKIARAPHDIPLGTDILQLRTYLIERNVSPIPGDVTHERKDTILTIVTRLLISSWLYGDPIGPPDARLRNIVNEHLRELATFSRQADQTPLYDAIDLLAPLARHHTPWP
ncbi:MAG: hypothetical protein ACREP9_06995 [Candidatus Dormibacteraceae bacterium]